MIRIKILVISINHQKEIEKKKKKNKNKNDLKNIAKYEVELNYDLTENKIALPITKIFGENSDANLNKKK